MSDGARIRTRSLPVVLGAALAALAVTLVAVALAKGGDGGSNSSSAGSAGVEVEKGVEPSDASGARVGQAAPAFSIRTLGGSTFSLPTGKPTVLYFMAAWCETCVPEAQALDRIERSLGDQVAILAVDVDPIDTVSSIREFAAVVGSPRYEFAKDEGAQLVRRFGVQALDTTVVVDRDGRIVFRDVVPTEEAALRSALAKAGVA